MKKKSAVIILALVVIALTSIAPTAYAGGQSAGGAKSQGPRSEIIIDVIGRYSAYTNVRSLIPTVTVTNEKGKVVFSGRAEGAPVDDEKLTDWIGSITIPIANGKYNVICGIPNDYRDVIYSDKAVNVELNYNRVVIEAKHNVRSMRNEIRVVSISTKGDPAVLARIEAAAPKVFADINAVLPAKLKPNAAIAIFPPNSRYTEYAEMALESLTKQFVNSNKYTVVEKRRVEELLAEYDFQKSGMVGEKTLGELLGADAVIFSTVTDDGLINAWAVDNSTRGTLAQSVSAQATGRGVKSLKMYPVTGGSNNETETINSFLAVNPLVLDNYRINDFSGSPEFTPYTDVESLTRTGRQRESLNKLLDAVISGSVQQIGRKNMLILNFYNTETYYRWTQSMDYADSLELWVKLQYAVSRIFDSEGIEKRSRQRYFRLFGFEYSSTQSSMSGYINSAFGTGVNRAEAETLTQLLISDMLSIPLKERILTGLYDATRAIEAGDKPEGTYRVNLNWNRNGSRTRLDVSLSDNRGEYRNSIEYGSPQEFLSKMRRLSVGVLEKMSGVTIRGYENYDLSSAVAIAPVPSSFTKINRVLTQRGVPTGGFYISTVPITQREYESVTKKNPSLEKDPNKPVSNVNIIDAILFCNQMSIRDGLEPVYFIEGAKTVSFNLSASGYRLPTTDEFIYARKQIKDMGVKSEYVFDGIFVQSPSATWSHEGEYAKHIDREEDGITDYDIMPIESGGGGNFVAYPLIRLVRPIFDYWKYTSGQ